METAGARRRLIATDGVFSMDGYLARLDEICDLAERHDALVMVDDSHAVGRRRPGRRRHTRAVRGDRARRHRHRHARQGGRRRERRLRRGAAPRSSSCSASAPGPYLFSNSLAPPVVAASQAALDLIQSSAELRDHLRDNTAHFRGRMTELGFDILPGEHPIVPVMIGDEVDRRALRRATRGRRASTRSASPSPSSRAARPGSARRCRPRTRPPISTSRPALSRRRARPFPSRARSPGGRRGSSRARSACRPGSTSGSTGRPG